ncbi:unnamed protein product [Spirodela intermedia]|uniref:Uncharacterized protein n=1 Tax=Spirodela intermedia TaxID=51605 RepID=A0ABN7E966_SPIIN|nr:unnamed protein product [Spirodela intermedia]
MAAAACKEGMNGHMFNGRACVVAFASPNTSQAMTQAQTPPSQGRSRGGGGIVFIIQLPYVGQPLRDRKIKPTKDRK